MKIATTPFPLFQNIAGFSPFNYAGSVLREKESFIYEIMNRRFACGYISILSPISFLKGESRVAGSQPLNASFLKGTNVPWMPHISSPPKFERRWFHAA